MSEILMQTGAELLIVRNEDGTYTARVGKKTAIFEDVQAAAEWACRMRDGGKQYDGY